MPREAVQDIAIRAEHISKIYPLYSRKSDRLREGLSLRKKNLHRDFHALTDISFEVWQGECVGFVGRNGSGKSTLLKILTGVLTPTSGMYEVNGTVSALLELGAGFNMEYTGIENLYLNGAVMGFSRGEMDAKIDEILDFADIGDFVYQPVKIYSSGMFVRLAFALAINVDPDVLIVDEALSVGDSYFQQKCYKKFTEFKERGRTILFVTHDLGSVIRYCSRAYLMDAGRILTTGRPKTIVDQYKKLIAGIALETEKVHEKQNITNLADLSENKSGDTWKSHYVLNSGELSYGDGGAEIIDFGIFDENNNLCSACSKGETYTFRIKVRIDEDIDDAIFAFTIKDVKGNEITGTNTRLEDVDTGRLKKGDIVTVSFTQRIDLQGTRFYLSFGVTKYMNDGTLKVFHRLYDIIELCVIAAKATVGWFDTNSSIVVEQEDRDPAKALPDSCREA